MSLNQAQITTIKERATDERARDAYPEPFPDLPPIPAARYSDPAFAALERDMVFGRSWLMVAHTDQVRNRGDYLLIEHLSIPMFLVRGHDDVIRAHANTCKHRGAALLDQPSGNTGRRLTCPYHSWVYDLDGELVGYPDAENFRELDPTCVALTSVRTRLELFVTALFQRSIAIAPMEPPAPRTWLARLANGAAREPRPDRFASGTDGHRVYLPPAIDMDMSERRSTSRPADETETAIALYRLLAVQQAARLVRAKITGTQ